MVRGIDAQPKNLKGSGKTVKKVAEQVTKTSSSSSVFTEEIKKVASETISPELLENAKKAAGSKLPKEVAGKLAKSGLKAKLLQGLKKCLKRPGTILYVGILSVATLMIAEKLQGKPFSLKSGIAPLLIQDVDKKDKTEKDFDWNENGKLDEDEQTAYKLYQKAMVKKHEEDEKADLLRKFDVNKDGKFDDVEKASMEAYYKEQKKIDDALFQQFDLDKNGKLDDKEKAALKAYQKALVKNN